MKQTIFSLLFALLPTVASADNVVINGVCYNLMRDKKSAEVTYKSNFEGYSGAVEIPATIEYEGIIYDVTRIGDDAFKWSSNLTSISIPNSVTNIGMNAFSDCSSLTSVTIPNSVTTISNYAFSWCSGLFAISLPECLTTIVKRTQTVMGADFQQVTKLSLFEQESTRTTKSTKMQKSLLRNFNEHFSENRRKRAILRHSSRSGHSTTVHYYTKRLLLHCSQFFDCLKWITLNR